MDSKFAPGDLVKVWEDHKTLAVWSDVDGNNRRGYRVGLLEEGDVSLVIGPEMEAKNGLTYTKILTHMGIGWASVYGLEVIDEFT